MPSRKGKDERRKLRRRIKERANTANVRGDFELMQLLDHAYDSIEPGQPDLDAENQEFFNQFRVYSYCIKDRKLPSLQISRGCNVDLTDFNGEDAWEVLAGELLETLHPDFIESLKKALEQNDG